MPKASDHHRPVRFGLPLVVALLLLVAGSLALLPTAPAQGAGASRIDRIGVETPREASAGFVVRSTFRGDHALVELRLPEQSAGAVLPDGTSYGALFRFYAAEVYTPGSLLLHRMTMRLDGAGWEEDQLDLKLHIKLRPGVSNSEHIVVDPMTSAARREILYLGEEETKQRRDAMAVVYEFDPPLPIASADSIVLSGIQHSPAQAWDRFQLLLHLTTPDAAE